MKKILLFALLLWGATSAYSAAVLDSVITTAGRNDKSKAVYSYDADGRNNLTISYTWSANQWTNLSKTENTFDANGNAIEVIYSMWDNNVWAKMYRYLYTYDANNAQTSFTYQGWNGTAWENSVRYTYKNRNDGVHYISVYWNWVNGKWYEADSTYISHNDAGNPTRMTMYGYHHKESGYAEEGWFESSYAEFTYNDKDQLIRRLEQVCNYTPGKTYTNNNKYEYEYDEKGDRSHHNYFYWSNNNWKQRDSKDYIYNDAHLLTQTILQNCTSGTCVNSQKEEHTYDAEGNVLTDAVYDWGESDWMQSNFTQYFYHNDGSEAIENIQSSEIKTQKVIRNGQVYIIRDGKTYNALGAEIK